jgi:hypothetical protein
MALIADYTQQKSVSETEIFRQEALESIQLPQDRFQVAGR